MIKTSITCDHNLYVWTIEMVDIGMMTVLYCKASLFYGKYVGMGLITIGAYIMNNNRQSDYLFATHVLK